MLPGVVDPLALGPNVFITTVGVTLLSGKKIFLQMWHSSNHQPLGMKCLKHMPPYTTQQKH